MLLKKDINLPLCKIEVLYFVVEEYILYNYLSVGLLVWLKKAYIYKKYEFLRCYLRCRSVFFEHLFYGSFDCWCVGEEMNEYTIFLYNFFYFSFSSFLPF